MDPDEFDEEISDVESDASGEESSPRTAVKKSVYRDDDEGDDSGSEIDGTDEIGTKRDVVDIIGEEEGEEEDENGSDNDDEEDEDLGVGQSKRQYDRKEISGAEMNDSDLDDEDDEDDEDDDEEDENYLQKFEKSVKQNIISEYHPEKKSHNYDEIDILTRIVRDKLGNIIDPLHRTLPFVTKYEKARIVGERAKQLNSGAPPFIEVESDVIDGYLIALEEFNCKKIPFIIRRPLPNGGSEYWRLSDLE